MNDEALDYQDAKGDWWIMAACGHRVGGSAKPGDKIALCPNCRFLCAITFQPIDVKYPDRIPDDIPIVQSKEVKNDKGGTDD